MLESTTVDEQQLLTALRALRDGDLSVRMPDAEGLAGEIARTLNETMDRLTPLLGEVAQIHREVGTEGRFGGQAEGEGLSGAWLELREGANRMSVGITCQIRDIHHAVQAVADGDFCQPVTVEAQGEVGELKKTLNAQIDFLNSFAYELTRLSRELGTEGKLGGQMEAPGAGGTWRDLVDNVNLMSRCLTDQLRDIQSVVHSIAEGDFAREVTAEARGETGELKRIVNEHLGLLNRFGHELTRVTREIGSEGKLGCQMEVAGAHESWLHLCENVNFMAVNLTLQLRNIEEVARSMSQGDYTKRLTYQARGEVLAAREHLNQSLQRLQAG